MERDLTSEQRRLAWEVLQLRYWQHLINELLKEKKFKIPIHLAIGHEAIAVALSNMVEPDDQIVLSHRNIAYNLSRSGSLDPIYQEYLLLPTGVANGKLGSMNLVNPERGIVYSSSILGNNIAVACGLALGKQTLGKTGIVIVLMGDGSVEEGTFYEGLVFSKSHHLPLLVIVENNDHSLASSIAQRRCPISISDMCAAVDMPFFELRGNNVWEYYEFLCMARQTVATASPSCIEVHLKAINNHAGPTPGWPEDTKDINLENGLVVEQSSNDPVFVLEKSVPLSVMAEMTEQLFAERWESD